MQERQSLIYFLESLPEDERNQIISEFGPAELQAFYAELDALYAQDPWAWLLGEVYTSDEATQAKLPWPDKAYLKDLFTAFQQEKKLFIPKSRRLMVSWSCSAWSVWNARYHPHHGIFYQSETEDKSAYITDKRCKFIEDNLNTAALRRKYHAIRTQKGSVGRITYNRTGSYIWAIPQGDDAIRSFTFSILIMDESEFQQEGQKAFVSALPIAEKGAQMIVVSTSNGPSGVLADVCRTAGFLKFT